MTELGGRTALKAVLGFDNVDALTDKWIGDAFVRGSDTPVKFVVLPYFAFYLLYSGGRGSTVVKVLC